MTASNDITKRIPGWNVKELVSTVDLDPVSRVDLTPEDFDRLIKQKGANVRVFRTMFCPQVKSIDGGEHEVDCKLCNGSGYLDRYPIETQSFLQALDLEKTQLPEGWLDGNSVSGTFPRGVELQYFTLVELLDFSDIYFQRVARSEGELDALKYKAQRVNVLVDYSGIEYFEATDFCLTPENGDVKWHAGRGPTPGTIYSVHYEAPVRFRAVKALAVNRFTQYKPKQEGGKVVHVKLPERWTLTKEFLVLRRDKNGDERLPNPIPGYDRADVSDEGDLG